MCVYDVGVPRHVWYCWWKKFCTSWYVVYPILSHDLQDFPHPRWLFWISSINRMSHGLLEGICNMALLMPRAVSTNTFGDQTLRPRVWELGWSHPSISNVGAAFVVIFVGFTVKSTHIWFVSWESWFNEMFNLGEVSLEKRICTSTYICHIYFI